MCAGPADLSVSRCCRGAPSIQFVDPQPAWSASRGASDFGFGRMTFNFTHAHYEYVGTFEFEDEKVLDDFWIAKI